MPPGPVHRLFHTALSASAASYPLPLDEAARLPALQPYHLLNTMQDETFAELVRLTAKLFRVPVCIVALAEDEVVRFGLNHGLPADLDRVSRGETLCSVALLQPGLTVFENLHAEPCALIDPGLVQRLRLGFYAGYTLRTPAGLPLGVLCVIDYQPRTFSPAEAALLRALAGVVCSLLDLRGALTRRPHWSQDLWADIYARIEGAMARLEALTVLNNGNSPAYQAAEQQQVLAILAVLHEHLHLARP